jgi:DNA-binding response OmpR family regulator
MEAPGYSPPREKSTSVRDRILVIDDDPSVSSAIRAVLLRRNIESEIASRAHAGIRAVTSSRFDLVMVDIFMPGLNGIDTIGHIRRQSPIPIIAMSGFRLRHLQGQEDYREMALQRGASTWLSKPFTPQQLVETIDRIYAASPASGIHPA